MKLLYSVIIMSILGVTIYWTTFNMYCVERFNYCYLQSYEDNPSCGVYFAHYCSWDSNPICLLEHHWIPSFYKCEGVL